MRFYRVELHSDADNHAGFTWHTSERDAKSQAATWRKNDPSDTSDGLEHRAHIEPIDIEPTRAGILAALKQYASHNDNG